MSNETLLLQVRNLRTTFYTDDGPAPAVNDVTFNIKGGEILGLVGESGCGKSVTSLSIMRLVSPPGKITGGEILFQGTNLLSLSEKEMRKVRGNQIAMIFQEPMTSLNPVMKVGDQIGESLRLHKNMTASEARKEAVRLIDAVKIPDAPRRLDEYPHHLSGGMRQRIMIAMALACRPAFLIADEPTTALDVTIQAQILDLLLQLRKDFNLSILLITHALGVVAEVADRVIVMYAGKVMEEAPVRELFANPLHPYTVGLLNSIPKLARDGRKVDRLATIEGTVPDLLHLPAGCSFYDRCSERMERCAYEFPPYIWVTPEHGVACHKYEGDDASRS